MIHAPDILQQAEKRRDEVAQILSRIVQIPSLSGEEEAVIQALKELVEPYADEVRIDGLGNLLARIGSGPKILAFDAHIDVVDVGDERQWSVPPFGGLIRDGKVWGRGSVDQKGGAAAMVTALRILRDLAYQGPFAVYFTFTIMEEDSDGQCWLYLIEEEGFRPDFVVITEPTNLGVYRGHRGRMEFDLYFRGRSAHASEPERGDNALLKAAKAALAVAELHRRLRSDPFLGKGSVAPTLIRSSSPSLCAIPDQCHLHLDRRLTWGEDRDSAFQELREILPPDTDIVIPVYDRPSYRGTRFAREKYYPTWKLPETHPLVQAGREAYEDLFGEPARIGRWTFSTNGVAIAGRHGIPTIGFGPGNEELAHAPDEAVPIDHLVKATAFYAWFPFVLARHTSDGP